MNNTPLVEYPKSKAEIIEEELRKDKKIVYKYNKPGIYAIKIEGKIVYIGKSLNMLKRLSQHMAEIQNQKPKSHKYQVLRQAHLRGIDITFDVIKKCYGKTFSELEDALGVAEAYYIQLHRPALNYQIPKIDSYWDYNTNEKAKTVCLYEIKKEEEN